MKKIILLCFLLFSINSFSHNSVSGNSGGGGAGLQSLSGTSVGGGGGAGFGTTKGFSTDFYYEIERIIERVLELEIKSGTLTPSQALFLKASIMDSLFYSNSEKSTAKVVRKVVKEIVKTEGYNIARKHIVDIGKKVYKAIDDFGRTQSNKARANRAGGYDKP